MPCGCHKRHERRSGFFSPLCVNANPIGLYQLPNVSLYTKDTNEDNLRVITRDKLNKCVVITERSTLKTWPLRFYR